LSVKALEAAAVVLLGALVLAIVALIARLDQIRSQLTPFLNSSIGQFVAHS